MNRFFQRSVLVLSLALLVAILAGEFGIRAVRAGSNDDGAYKQMRVYSEVLKKVQTEYVTDPSIPDVTNGALHGLLESLDPDSSYLTAAEYKAYKAHPEGNAQVGLTVSKRYGYALVVSVAPGSPAEKEHFSDGDAIESIDGRSVRETPLAMIRMLLEGKPGTQVSMSVIRPRKPDGAEKITLTRSILQPPAMAEQQYDNSSILYLKPGVLSAARVDEIAARIRTMTKSGNKKVLLDLRDVARGDEEQGIRLANFFLKQGTIATLSGQKYPQQTFSADSTKFLTDAPLALLVNRGTAGAAELAAAALAEDKRADVVGERTFGEGSVQKTIELPDGGALLLTVATYSSPGGKKFLEEAVTPTVLVGPTPEQEAAQETAADEDTAPAKTDAPLNKALEILKSKAA